MKRKSQFMLLLSIAAAAIVIIAARRSPAESIGTFRVTSLIGSAGSGAHRKDTNMVNAWGDAFFPGEPFWINDEGTGVSELIDGRGVIFRALPLVTIPGASGGKGKPTGIVANATAGFVLSVGGPALFIFDAEDGTISGWNESLGTAATLVVNNSGQASYTGLALAQSGTASQLYAANRGVSGQPGSIDVFDANFNPVTPSGGFIDPNLPANFSPYNIANIDGNLFVSYSDGAQAVGQVDEFDPNGNLIMTFTSDTLAAPWGMAVAPADFGMFGNDLLVGNLVSGTISVFNLTNGEFLGQLVDSKLNTITIPGLWSLAAGDGALHARADGIYFTAGPDGYAEGLFGVIQPGPEVKVKPTKTPTPTTTPTDPTPTKTPGDPTPTPTPRMGY